MSFKTAIGTALVLGVMAMLPSTASAAAALRISSPGQPTVTIQDGSLVPLDFLGQPDRVGWSGSIGVFNVVVSTGFAFPGTSLPELMHTNSTQQSSAGGTVTIEFTQTGFNFFSPSALISNWDITFAQGTSGSYSYQAYYSTTNTQFAQTTPIGALLTNDGVVSGVAPVGPGLYSITQVMTITHNAAQSTSFNSFVSVPEPASITLFGIGLAGLAALGRRRRKSVE